MILSVKGQSVNLPVARRNSSNRRNGTMKSHDMDGCEYVIVCNANQWMWCWANLNSDTYAAAAARVTLQHKTDSSIADEQTGIRQARKCLPGSGIRYQIIVRKVIVSWEYFGVVPAGAD